MNIEKTLISAIIALGIAGSAALAAGGRMDTSLAKQESPTAASVPYSEEATVDGLLSGHAFDSHELFLDI